MSFGPIVVVMHLHRHHGAFGEVVGPDINGVRLCKPIPGRRPQASRDPWNAQSHTLEGTRTRESITPMRLKTPPTNPNVSSALINIALLLCRRCTAINATSMRRQRVP